MENKNIIWIIGIIAVLISAGIVYAGDPQTVGDLKLGDTVKYNGKETTITKIEPGADFSDNPSILGIELESGEYIRKVSDAPLSSASMTFVKRAGSATQPAPTPAPTTKPATGTTQPAPAAAPTPTPAQDKTTFGQLKAGDTVWYKGQQTKVSATVPATTNPNRIYVYLEAGGDPIVGNSNDQVASKGMTKNAPTAAGSGTTGTVNLPDQYSTGIGGQTSPAPTPAEEGKKPTAPASTARPFRTGVFISQFLAAYDQYRGLAKFGSLFMTSEHWEQHREKVNQAFCDTIIFAGTQCWTSRICDTQLYRNMPASVFAGRTPSGERVATASIQGEKSLPIAALDKNNLQIDMRVYKVTYAIRNPYDSQEMKYNVQFRTDDGHTFDWYDEQQTLGPGTSQAITEDSPLIDYGTYDYKEVCLIFNPSIVDYKNYPGRRIREWCADIAQYMGTATKPYPAAADDTAVTPETDATQPPAIPTAQNRREGF